MTIKKRTKNDQKSATLQGQSCINTVHEEEIQQSVHLAAGDEALEASADVTLAGSNLEVTVNDARNRVSYNSSQSEIDGTYVTARRIPVPLPRAPRRSEATERAPMQAPPNAAAVGMTRFSSLYMDCSR